jgi:hypothetical protein
MGRLILQVKTTQLSVGGEKMKIENLKVGMKVQAVKKSIHPEAWADFLAIYPSGIATITSIEKGVIYIASLTSSAVVFKFYADDLEPAIGASQAKCVKTITIKNLLLAKMPSETLKKFIQEVVEISIQYAWDPIPADIAQQIAIKLQVPSCLIQLGFIRKKDEIEKVKVIEQNEEFNIQVALAGGGTYNILSILKDGSGFIRYSGIPVDVGLVTTLGGKLIDRTMETKW